MALWLLVVSAPAALVNVSNVSSNTNGGYAIVNESGSFLSDPPGVIAHVGPIWSRSGHSILRVVHLEIPPSPPVY